MKESPQRQSHGPSFIAIYLIITVAIVAAVLTLKPPPKEVSLSLPDEERFIKKDSPAKPSPVPKHDRDPNPPLPKPIPSLDSSKQETAKKEDPKPEPASKKDVPSTEPPKETTKEPSTPTLTAEQEKEIEELYPFPKIRPLMEIVGNWRSIPDTAFPKLVAIRKPITFDMSQGGTTVASGKLPAGSMMVPVRLMGEDIMLKTAGAAPITTTIPVADTDFRESIQKHYNRYVEQVRNKVVAQREAERWTNGMGIDGDNDIWEDGGMGLFAVMPKGGHFDRGGSAVPQNAIARLDRLGEGASDRRRHESPPRGVDKGLDYALTFSRSIREDDRERLRQFIRDSG